MATREEIQKEMQAIFDEYGYISPTLVLKAARNKESALHSKFEWDKDKAAFQYQLGQARRLIKIIEITYEGVQDKMVHIPIILSDGGTKEGKYKPIRAIVSQPDEYELALGEAIRFLKGANDAVELLRKCKRKRSYTRASKHIKSAVEELQT